MAGRGYAALIRPGIDHHAGESRLLQITTDQRGVMIAVRRACQEPGRIAGKDFSERVRHIVREHVLLNAIPYAEQETSPGLEDPLCLTVARLAVGEEHHSKLATNEIEGGIFERQRLGIGLAPTDATVGDLSRS